MANQRTEYNFLSKAISELGSVDAPNKWTWNIFGYMIPGILISVFSVGLYKNIKIENSSKLPLIGIFMSGIFMAISGVFPGDFDNKTSITMLLHTIGSFGSYIFFLISAFSYPKQMKKSAYWTTAIKPTLIFTWLTILFGGWVFYFSKFSSSRTKNCFLYFTFYG